MEKSYCLHTVENDKCTGLCVRNIAIFKIKNQEVNIEFTDMWKEEIYYSTSFLQPLNEIGMPSKKKQKYETLSHFRLTLTLPRHFGT